MKKNNNGKFRSSSSNNTYNLNYRFDSISPAGKFSGTALDLIKRYNDLAKEALSSGNYVEMEVFRQYAEHYRKIVTEINERKNAYQVQNQQEKAETLPEDKPQEEQTSSLNSEQEEKNEEVLTQKPLSLKKKTLKIVEIKEESTVTQEASEKNENKADIIEKPKAKRVCHRKPKIDPSEAAAV